MDNEGLDLWAAQGQTNNPPPRQADIAGPRQRLTLGRIPYGVPFEGQYPLSSDLGSIPPCHYEDPRIPAGTSAFAQHAFLPVNANFFLQDQPSGGDVGGHNYLPFPIRHYPELHNELEMAIQHPAWDKVLMDTALMTGLQPCTGTDSYNRFGDPYLNSAELDCQNQLLALEGMTTLPEPSVSQDLVIPNWLNDMMSGQQHFSPEELNEMYIPSTFGTTGPNDQTSQFGNDSNHTLPYEILHDLGLQHQLIQRPSEKGSRLLKRQTATMERQVKRACPGLTTSQGAFGNFEPKKTFSSCQAVQNAPRRNTKTRRTSMACIRCRRLKRSCDGNGEKCDGCSEIACRCIKKGEPIPSLTSLDLTVDHKIDFSQQTSFDLLGSYRTKATIFVGFSTGGPIALLKRIVPLNCEVQEFKVHSEVAADVKLKAKIWEGIQVVSNKLNAFQPEMLWEESKVECFGSYRIPEESMPSANDIQEWALNTLSSDPQCVIGKFQGELWIVSTEYLQSETRPLRELVSLIRKYTAMYNISNSKLSLLLNSKPKAIHQACPWLRAQICLPALTSIGAELKESLKRTVFECREQSDDTRLAMAIVFWFLMLIYKHSDDQARTMAILSLAPKTISYEDLSSTRQHLEDSLLFIRDLYENWFKQKGGMVFPKLGEKDMQCKTKNLQDAQLEIVVANLQTAIRRWGQDFESFDGSAGTILKSLINFDEEVKGIMNWEASPPVVDLSFDKCSTTAEALIDDGNALLKEFETLEISEEDLDVEYDENSQQTATDSECRTEAVNCERIDLK